jgi:uncharacterized membrane protein YbhN (UPF0104 family)
VKQKLQRVLPFAVSLAVLAWLLRGVDLAALGASLTGRVVAVLVPSLVVYGAATLWLEAQSLSRLAHGPGALSAWTAARIKCASYLIVIVNYALGAGALALLLRRRAGMPLARAASLVILIATADLVVVLSMAGAGSALVRSGPTVHAGLVATAIVGLFGGLLLLRMPRSLGPLERIRGLSAFDALRTVPLGDLALLFSLRIAFAICFVAVCGSAFFAFRVPAPLPELVAGVLIVAVVAAIPIAVAGLGTSQFAFVYLFGAFAPRETLLAMSLVLSAGMLALRALMGVVFAREFTREALRDARSAAP